MKKDWSHLDDFRFPHPITGYLVKGDTVGCFQIPRPQKDGSHYIVIACDGSDEITGGWEHVSVHVRKKRNGKLEMLLPTWMDMCFIKALFWEDTEIAIQFHPPASEHVNVHEYVLHLWSNPSIITPPIALV